MEQSGFIVGIDLGTSKIIGVLGRKNEQGVISILASESIPSDSCVKYGVIYNIDEAAGKIKKLISLLENKTGKKIGKAYVSIAGKSLRAVEHKETKLLDGYSPITFAVLDSMDQQAKWLTAVVMLINAIAIGALLFMDISQFGLMVGAVLLVVAFTISWGYSTNQYILSGDNISILS